MKLISFDPGQATGIAWFDSEQLIPVVGFKTTWSKKELFNYLKGFTFESLRGYTVVVEDYINRPAKNKGYDHSWDRGYTHRVIGALEYWAFEMNLEFVLQQPYIKKPMYGLLGLKEGTKKESHTLDAIVHGYKYLHSHKILDDSRVIGAMKGAK